PGVRSASSSSLASRGSTTDRASAAKAASAPPSGSPDPPANPVASQAPEHPTVDSPAAGTGEHPAPGATAAEPAPAAAAPATPDSGEKSVPGGEGAAKTPAAPVEKSLSAPATAKPAVPTAATVITRDQLIARRAQELRLVEAKRRQVDERYDPAKAIASQTRYLVRMARRYGSLDWVFQAYHGGEGGVRNTVGYYLGARARQFPTTECAIRGMLASRG